MKNSCREILSIYLMRLLGCTPRNKRKAFGVPCQLVFQAASIHLLVLPPGRLERLFLHCPLWHSAVTVDLCQSYRHKVVSHFTLFSLIAFCLAWWVFSGSPPALHQGLWQITQHLRAWALLSQHKGPGAGPSAYLREACELRNSLGHTWRALPTPSLFLPRQYR